MELVQYLLLRHAEYSLLVYSLPTDSSTNSCIVSIVTIIMLIIFIFVYFMYVTQ